ncbi:hypothetical protein U1Q18_038869 [Sarracenia purpurea var. burkii]
MLSNLRLLRRIPRSPSVASYQTFSLLRLWYQLMVLRWSLVVGKGEVELSVDGWTRGGQEVDRGKRRREREFRVREKKKESRTEGSPMVVDVGDGERLAPAEMVRRSPSFCSQVAAWCSL